MTLLTPIEFSVSPGGIFGPSCIIWTEQVVSQGLGVLAALEGDLWVLCAESTQVTPHRIGNCLFLFGCLKNFEWHSTVDFWGKMYSTFLNYNICYLMSAGGLFFQTSRTYFYKIKWYAPENYCTWFWAFLYLGSSYDAGPLSPSFHLLWICKGCCVWQLH